MRKNAPTSAAQRSPKEGTRICFTIPEARWAAADRLAIERRGTVPPPAFVIRDNA